jgi:hypothetical protein
LGAVRATALPVVTVWFQTLLSWTVRAKVGLVIEPSEFVATTE